MRILYFGGRSVGTALAKVNTYTVDYLVELGHDVAHVVPNIMPSYVDRTVTGRRVRVMPFDISIVGSVVEAVKPDAIVLMVPPYPQVVEQMKAFAVAAPDVPMIYYVTFEHVNLGRPWLAPFAFVHGGAVPTPHNLELIRSYLDGRQRDLVRAVWHGVSRRVFSPGDKLRSRRALGLPSKGILVGMVGRNSYRKDFWALARVIRRLREKGRDIRLVIHTDQVVREIDLTLIIYREKLHEVSYTITAPAWDWELEPRTQAHVYRSLDVYVQASTGEGFGMPIIEAMACGVPVVAGYYTAMPDVGGRVAIYYGADTCRSLLPSECQQCVPDEDGLLEAVEHAIQVSQDRAELESFRDRAERHLSSPLFSWLESAKRLERLLLDVVSERPTDRLKIIADRNVYIPISRYARHVTAGAKVYGSTKYLERATNI